MKSHQPLPLVVYQNISSSQEQLLADPFVSILIHTQWCGVSYTFVLWASAQLAVGQPKLVAECRQSVFPSPFGIEVPEEMPLGPVPVMGRRHPCLHCSLCVAVMMFADDKLKSSTYSLSVLPPVWEPSSGKWTGKWGKMSKGWKSMEERPKDYEREDLRLDRQMEQHLWTPSRLAI